MGTRSAFPCSRRGGEGFESWPPLAAAGAVVVAGAAAVAAAAALAAPAAARRVTLGAVDLSFELLGFGDCTDKQNMCRNNTFTKDLIPWGR